MREILSGGPPLPYVRGMDSVTLPPDLEQFATEAVAAGRYRDVSEVVATGIGLVRRLEAERAAFVRTLEDAGAEADRDGWHSLDDVMAEADEIIASMRTTG
jgi:antitoxin ParD1/3/4